MTDSSILTRLSLRQLAWACLGVMTVIFVVVSAVSILGQIKVARAVDELSGHVVPIRADVEALRRAFTDQETGERGFLLTGNPVSLDPYNAGTATADQLLTDLHAKLAGDPEATRLLDGAADAAGAWRSQAADPQIAARGRGPLPADQQEGMALQGKRLFDTLRSRLRELAAYVDGQNDAQLSRIQSVQKTAAIVQAVGAAILLATLVVAVVVVDRLLTRPVNAMVEQVQRVADGDYDHPITATGPRETAEIGDAVEQMRESLRASTDRLVDSELRDEQARIAADLHDRVIQRVFGLGLGLTSASARRNPDLEPFIDETDAIIRDLREVIFNLHHAIAPPGRSTRMRAAIIDVVESSVAALGFTPTLQFEGPVDEAPIRPDLHAAVLAVVRESLSNVARHAQGTAAWVNVVVTASELRVIVRDNGIGVTDADVLGHGRRNIASRAEQFGGEATIGDVNPGAGAVVEWVVPLQPLPTDGGRRREVDLAGSDR
ncbi:CHASE3 domain-containing protein [Mycolicibacterium chubuense]|nr:CHASE3 domain-containing protein [Mycolicibacterium chubuense]